MKDFKELPFTAAGMRRRPHQQRHPQQGFLQPDHRAGAPAPACSIAGTVARLFYLTLTEQLSRTSGFGDSRRGLELVARSLFRVDPERTARMATIAQAFDDVGIEPYTGEPNAMKRLSLLLAVLLLAPAALRAQPAQPKVEIEINRTPETADDYVTWAPTFCQARLAGGGRPTCVWC